MRGHYFDRDAAPALSAAKRPETAAAAGAAMPLCEMSGWVYGVITVGTDRELSVVATGAGYRVLPRE